MILRRAEASRLLLKNESLLSISFPSLGVPGFTDPPAEPNPDDPEGAGRSIFFPDDAIYPGHPRWGFFLTFNVCFKRKFLIILCFDEQIFSLLYF